VRLDPARIRVRGREDRSHREQGRSRRDAIDTDGELVDRCDDDAEWERMQEVAAVHADRLGNELAHRALRGR
jgi:hypothetical protein